MEFLLLCLVLSLPFLTWVAVRAQAMSRQEQPTPRNNGAIEKLAFNWAMFAKAKRRRLEELEEKWAAADAKPAPPEYDPTQSTVRSIAVDARLEQQFQRFRAGELTLEQYQSDIEAEKQRLLDEKEDLSFAKSLDREFKEIEREDIERALGQTEWRLDWVGKLLERDAQFQGWPN